MYMDQEQFTNSLHTNIRSHREIVRESHGGGSRPLPPTCFVEMKNGHPVHMWTRIFEGTEGKTKEEAQHVHVSTISIPLYGLNLSPFEYMQIKEF